MTALRIALALCTLAGIGVGALFTGSLLVIAGRGSRDEEACLARMRDTGQL